MLREELAPPAALTRTPSARAERGLLATSVAYLALTKPRIVVLLLVTTVPSMIVAEGGWPSIGLVLLTLLGGTLAAGGANAINCYVDRDIDGLMHRTRSRPLPSGVIAPERALAFGLALGALAFVILLAGANLLSALLATAALAFYVFVYTLWLKRSSPQNIVIGGAAGAMPPMVGWAAVTGGLGWAPVLLFLVIFLWTPPHFWALALRYQGDYARAGVPMLPVVRGDTETRRQMLLYSIALVATTLVLAPVAGLGVLYFGVAAALGAVFLLLALRLRLSASPLASRPLFLYSIFYLALLFVAMAADRLLLA